jgi:alkylation response protein AidB-like acyl-CoA dehydrogenase
VDLSFSVQEEEFASEIRGWLADNLTQPPSFSSLDEEIEWGRAWQAKMAASRWVAIGWPVEHGGRGATPVQVAIYNAEYARARAPQPVNRVGINLAGPTLLAHGSESQRARWLPRILTAEELWCQLFSEPGAGSDLASLTTRAERSEGGWLLTGQKVWTSYALQARWGICLARTSPEGRRGLTYFVVDMEAPGVEVRPLVQITGEAEFNEVFLDAVFVPDDQVVGEVGNGWAVAATTLSHERGTSFPFKEEVVHEVYLDELFREALQSGALDSVEVSDELSQSYVELALLRLHNWRTLSRLAKGLEPGPESSIVKLAWSDMTQLLSSAALDLLGGASPLWGRWQRQWLWSKAASIAGGTSEIQRNILAERLLGLPRG